MRRVKQLLRSLRAGAKAGPPPGGAVVSAGSLSPFDPSSREVVADPYPLYARLRGEDPVHRCQPGAWLLTRYDDVLAALTDERLGNAPSPYAVVNARNRERYVCADVATQILPFLDPPQHTSPRRIIGKCFRDQLRKNPADMRALAEATLIKACEKGAFDLIADYGTPFSVAVLGHLMGIPAGDNERLVDWSEWFFYLFMQIPNEEVRVKLDAALVEFREYFGVLIEARLADPQDDFVTALAQLEGDTLTRQGIVDTCMLIFADGVENVDKAIAGTFASLTDAPGEMELLRNDPALLASCADELLRFDSPAQLVGRVALEEFTLHGKTIARGSSVLLGLASANRDEQRFPQADRLDLKREAGAHLSFGKARHTCIGAPLVRDELVAGLAALLAGSPLKIVSPKRSYRARPGHRWLSELRVSV